MRRTQSQSARFAVPGYEAHKEAHRALWELDGRLKMDLTVLGRRVSMEYWRVGNCSVYLNRVDSQYFIQIVGVKKSIDELRRAFGLLWSQKVSATYRDLISLASSNG